MQIFLFTNIDGTISHRELPVETVDVIVYINKFLLKLKVKEPPSDEYFRKLDNYVYTHIGF